MSYDYERVEITLKREDGSVWKGTLNTGEKNHCYVVFLDFEDGDTEVSIDGVFAVTKEQADGKA